MLQKVFATEVTGKADMARLEAVVVGLLGGEHHRCAFLRSGEYQRFRNAALYGNRGRRVVEEEEKLDPSPLLSVHVEGLKLVLTSTRLACVYVTDPVVVPVPPPPTTSSEIAEDDEAFACASLVGKRRRMVPMDSDDD